MPNEKQITIFEVGPRDGLQNVKNNIATADKVGLINALSKTGLTKIEATSFVNPKWIPQLADAKEVMAQIERHKHVDYSVLTPNCVGLERAIVAKADEVSIFTSASEGFCQANLNCTIEQSFERFVPLMQKAKSAGIKVRGYISNIIECPFDGVTDPSVVAVLTKRLIDIGCYEVSLGDTLGKGDKNSVKRLMQQVIKQVSAQQLAGHFHDTYGRALENVDVCLEFGVSVFDSSIGGIGGCPYAPGAKGNVATEKLVQHVEGFGFKTGVDVDALHSIAQNLPS
ncbi:MAG: hydroxymethylglutaryl-CoA lyase [Hyphomicrobiales bacterium]|nr:MAG: hydroxymethylglutaryl-CoA lyase [Hyphomicrobiales bacterium]